MKYWIGVVSKEHVLKGKADGILQIDHGKEAPLKKMHKGDGLIYYSPTVHIGDKTPYQQFTALGYVDDETIYQVEINKQFHPFRRSIQYQNTHDVSIRPFIQELDCIKNKTNWGYVFRFGLIEITKKDFDMIAKSMIE